MPGGAGRRQFQKDNKTSIIYYAGVQISNTKHNNSITSYSHKTVIHTSSYTGDVFSGDLCLVCVCFLQDFRESGLCDSYAMFRLN